MRFALPTLFLLTVAAVAPSLRWGEDGHEMAARAATRVLPSDVPRFFRSAADQLVYFDPEPDRWRGQTMVELDQSANYDHYIDLENVREEALRAPDRFVYLRMLYESGLERPERDAGFLPFRIVELYQRLVTEWRLWRVERDSSRRRWIEQRIIYDAGILGHYVTDAAQPHHSTIHFNGWSETAPNPEGYTLDRTFHSRFESDFVTTHVRQADVNGRVRSAPRSLVGSVRPEVLEHIRGSNAQVETLYRLERDFGFDPARAAPAESRDFAAERLAVGARMLADLWWTAWLESATFPPR